MFISVSSTAYSIPLNASVVKIVISANTLKQNEVGQWDDILNRYCPILILSGRMK